MLDKVDYPSLDTATLLNPDSLEFRSSLGSSNNSTPAVKFAPLPQIDPGRKRTLAPLGVSARSRRRRLVQQEADALWSVDHHTSEEDPFVTLAKLVKKTGRTLWRKVRKARRVQVQDEPEVVLDIKPSVPLRPEAGSERARRASWSPPEQRRTLIVKRRSTSDLR